jgi:hypothetical protein
MLDEALPKRRAIADAAGSKILEQFLWSRGQLIHGPAGRSQSIELVIRARRDPILAERVEGNCRLCQRVGVKVRDRTEDGTRVGKIDSK